LRRSKLELALRTTLLYLLFGALWILLSDQILSFFVLYNTQQVTYQTLKGWFFILASGILLYLLLRREMAARKGAEQEITWLASFPERNPNPVVEIDFTGAVFYMNPAAQDRFPDLREQGFKHPLLEGLELMIDRFKHEGIGELQREIQIDNDWYSQPVYYLPEAGRLRVYGTEITERKRAEQQTIHMKRLYSTLSQVNQTIVRVKNRDELYRAICDVVVKFGGFSAAWIGLLDEGPGEVRPIVANGPDVNNWSFPAINIHTEAHTQGPIARAIHSSSVSTSEKLQTEENVQIWYDQLQQRGWYSAAVIPFSLKGRTIGTLILVSQEKGLFNDEDEVRLLDEMGLDISFALDILETEAERKQAEEEIQSRSRQLSALLEASQSLTESLNLAQTLQKITDKVVDVLRVEKTAIYLADGEHLYLGASTPPLPPEFPETLRRAMPADHPHIAEALVTGQSVIVTDTASAPLTPAEQMVSDTLGLRSLLYVPLAAKKDAIGILILGTMGVTRKFSRSERDLALALSNQAALAITNAKLYEDLVRHVQELENQITERKQAEEALYESEERLRLSLQAANQGLYDLNVQTGDAIVNREYAQMLGYDPETFVETNAAWIKRLHPDDHESVAKAYSDYISGLLPEYRIEFRQRMQDNNWKWILSLGKVIEYDAEGKPLRMLGTHTDITERKQAEKALRESEERFRLLFENNHTVMMLIEPVSGSIKNANMAAAEFYGYSLSELCAMNINDINTLTPDEVQAERMRALKEERNFFNFQHRLSNSEIRSVEVHSAPIEVDDNTLLFSIVYDVTERKLAEEALHNSQAQMTGIFNSAMDAIISTDAAQHILIFNPAAEAMFRCSQSEAIGQPLERFIPSRFRSAHSNHVENFAQTGATNRAMGHLGVLYGLRKDGVEFPIEASISKINMSGNELFTVILRDVTERKQAEKQIQRQIKHLNALRMVDIAISSSFDLNIILNVVLQQVFSQLGADASAIILLNPHLQTIEYAASRGFRSNSIQHTRLKLGEGYASQAVLERQTIHISALMESGSKLAKGLPFAREEFTDYYGIPLIVKGEVKGVLEIYHRSHLKTDSEWLEFLEALAGQAAIAIDNAQLFENLQRSNLTLECRVEERTRELNRTNAELEHANRIKDEFLANMSHELRTPLTSILGLSEALLEEIRDPLSEYQHKSLQIIESSGRHLLELINDILDLSKIEAGKFDFYPQPVSVDEICKSSLSFVKSQAVKKSITVTYIQDISISRIFADPRRLKQILVNLLSNAVKFTPTNGEVILQINADLEQDLIKFSIIDNGIGIAAQDLRRLFQPFVQVDSGLNRQHEGTGLGLALVQKLTDLHGGSVQVESEVGKGSRFTINLPCLQEEMAKLEKLETHPRHPIRERAENTEVPVEAPLHLGLILLADDNMPSVLTIGEYLESHGYEVVVAHDGSEAVEKAEAIHPDLILMDIQMPVMNGLEAIARLRGNARFADMPIIALTALAMPGDRERSLLAGANEYMSKPVSLKLLAKTINELLGKQA
jgi:PAS domain S-box-containing protein